MVSLEFHQKVGFEEGEFLAVSIAAFRVGDWEGGWQRGRLGIGNGVAQSDKVFPFVAEVVLEGIDAFLIGVVIGLKFLDGFV